MRPTFVLFSGLPGTGKSALADMLARDLKWPLLRIDDLAACIPEVMDRNTTDFWDLAIAALLHIAEVQLKMTINVIADSIFMNLDRMHAAAIARECDARLVPVYMFISDEMIWKERVTARFLRSSLGEDAASWTQVMEQQKGFRPWEPGTALFVDGVRPLEENFQTVRSCVCDPKREFSPMAEVAFIPGKYHK
jgi:predicted kinase